MSTRAVNEPSQSFTITEKAPTRYLSLASVGEAQRAVCCSFLMSNTLMLLTGWLGLVMYAAYQHCDPITAGQVTNTAVCRSLSLNHFYAKISVTNPSKRDEAKPMILQNSRS